MMTKVLGPGILFLAVFAVAIFPAAGEESGLTVVESGVGSAVENRVLVGESDRFQVGDEVWFWTRVNGGAEGDRIHHVWVKDGEEKLILGLSIGGSHWRTWSHKMMHPGSEGEWTVEARDQNGEVLATVTFLCEGIQEE
jgi:hypothetical protein